MVPLVSFFNRSSLLVRTSRLARPVFVLPVALAVTAALVPACGNDNLRETPGAGGEAADAGKGYTGSAVVIPATIEAEAFVAANEENQDYDEQDESCQNPVSPDTDILSIDDGAGCVIGYTVPGEWLEYDVYTAEAGSFDFQFRAGTGMASSLELSIDGETRGSVSVPVGSWEEFGDLKLPGVPIPAGEHRLRVTIASGAVNLDWFAVLAAGDCIASCGERTCGQDECGNSCGTCSPDETCSVNSQCLDAEACAATCGDKICGTDDCGGSCGSCDGELVCTPKGECWDGSVKPVERHGQLRVDGTKIVDEHDEVTQLKGLSTQWLNWEKEYSSSLKGLQWFRDNWALSLLRIANGVENSDGYLEDPTGRMALVQQIIDNAIASDVYVLVDWHTHSPDHLDEAKAFFKAIAQKYGDKPNIIYELFNEPLDLDWSADLKPYHEALITEIRKYDPDNLIVVGTPQWDQHPEAAIDDPLDDANVLYTLHFYACTHQGWLRDNGDAALLAGLPLFVSEWGATDASGGAESPSVCEASAREWHAWMEENDLSWAAWKLSADGDSSALMSASAPVDGGWTDEDFKGHAYLVHEFMMDEL